MPGLENAGQIQLTSSVSLPLRLRRSATRWFSVFSFGVLGSIAFESLLPLASSFVISLSLPYQPKFVSIVTWVAAFLLFYVATEPIRIRRHQWRHLVWYPSTWVSIPIAYLLAVAAERFYAPIRIQTANLNWQQIDIVLPIAAALLAAVILHQLPWKRRNHIEPTSSATPSLTRERLQEWLSSGEYPIRHADQDFFQHHRVSSRIATMLVQDKRSVAVLGHFGSGKTSILNLLRADLHRTGSTLVVADFDVWAVPRPADVPRLALDRIITALDDYVDTIALRDLPVSYQRLAAAVPNRWLQRVLSIRRKPADSLEELQRLTPILEAANAQIVLIVQDVDRAGATFDTRHLQRLLWALRGLPRVTFVLATDPTDSDLDFSKLCDSIELLRPLGYEQVAPIVNSAFAHWMSAYSYVDPHPDRQGGKLGLSYLRIGGAFEHLRRASRDTPMDYVIDLVQTPRALKHVLRRVDGVWRDLHGEVDLDDVFILAILRETAQPVYDFLVSHVDAARLEQSELVPETMTVADSWRQLLDGQPNAHATQRVVDLLGIARVARSQPQGATVSPQGVHQDGAVDYFRRIVAEQLDADEVRDQAVLRDIDGWREDRLPAMVDKLVAGTVTVDAYVQVWEHFSDRCSEEELVELTSVVAQHVLQRDGAAASAEHPALLALWRRCNRRLAEDRYAQWLLEIIMNGLSVSLHFANGFYYYWTGEYGIVSDQQRSRIRAAVVAGVREQIRSGAVLAARLCRGYPWDVGHLIRHGGSAVADFRSWRDHLGPILAQGAEIDPELVMPEVANVIATDASTNRVAGAEPPVFVNPYHIDRERSEALFGELLDAVLVRLATYDGTDPYAARAKEAASRWLAERRARSG